MAIEFVGDTRYIGLKADVKVAKPAGSILDITDTGDRFISDGTYWWITNHPSSLSTHRIGGSQDRIGSSLTVGMGLLNALLPSTGIGAPSFVNTDLTNGRYLSIPSLGTAGNRGGYRYNASTLLTRSQNFKIRGRFMAPAAADHTTARLYIGVCNNQELTGDAPLDNISGAMIGFLNAGTHYKVFHNDGGAVGDYDDDVHTTAQALDELIHEFRIVADDTVPRISIKWDNNPYVHITTDIPTQTAGMTILYQNETAENAVKTFRLYGLRVETDW